MSSGTLFEQQEIERLFLGLAVEAQQQIPASFDNPKKQVIVIAGPTGCGKSEFALALAKKIGGEIIAADSMQVYRGMDIGTAKASIDDRNRIPHHLLDTRSINEHFNVVDFYYEARQACESVLSRNKVPLIVGGSGFYLHSLIYGPPNGPPSLPELRGALEKEMSLLGVETLYERVHQLDPQYANSIARNDKQKIIRALEIMTLTGKPVSKLAWKARVKPQTYDFHCWFLVRPREILYRRIDKRCDKMLAEGFVEEVERLQQEGLQANPSAAQAIGYRQALAYLSSEKTPEDYHRFTENFKRASHQYAKRQLTWFKKEPLFRWLDLDLHDSEVALDIVIQEFYAK